MTNKPDKKAQAIFYPTPPTSEASSQATSQAPSGAPSPSAPLNMRCYLTEGLKDAECRGYIDTRSFAGAVKSQTKVAEATSGVKYVTFSPVSEVELTKVDKLRDDHYKTLRFMYLEEHQTLIVKIMPGAIHEVATSRFARMFDQKATVMGLGIDDFDDMGGTRYQGRSTCKEADSAIKPGSRPGSASWPTLVLESGVSETIERLRIDAHWWLTNSPASGPVNIVLVFSIKKANHTIEIEQWEVDSGPPQHVTRQTTSSTNSVPKCVRTIKIPQQNSDKRTLTLDFKKVFDRDPVNDTLEANFEFTPFDLSKWAAGIWRHDSQGEF